MDLYDSRVIEDVTERISKEADAQTHALAECPSLDLASYLRRVGHIKGLRHAALIIDGVKKDFGVADKGEPWPLQRQSSYEE